RPRRFTSSADMNINSVVAVVRAHLVAERPPSPVRIGGRFGLDARIAPARPRPLGRRRSAAVGAREDVDHRAVSRAAFSSSHPLLHMAAHRAHSGYFGATLRPTLRTTLSQATLLNVFDVSA